MKVLTRFYNPKMSITKKPSFLAGLSTTIILLLSALAYHVTADSALDALMKNVITKAIEIGGTATVTLIVVNIFNAKQTEALNEIIQHQLDLLSKQKDTDIQRIETQIADLRDAFDSSAKENNQIIRQSLKEGNDTVYMLFKIMGELIGELRRLKDDE